MRVQDARSMQLAADASLRRLRTCIATACLLQACFSASARTWTVMKDGSGDFTVIQDAINAAASGDVISVGPGRFEDVHSFQLPGGIQEAHCRATQTQLTIVGSGPELTIIGPADGPGTEQDPIGIMGSPSTRLYVRDLSVENTDDGVQANGPYVSLQNCLFRGCDQGLDTVAWEGTQVTESTFVNSQGTGIVVFQGLGATNVLIEECEFLGGIGGVDLQSDAGLVRNCRFVGQTGGGLQLSFGAQATIEGCTFEEILSYGVVITGGSRGVISGSVIGLTQIGLLVINGSHLSGSENILMGGTVYTIALSGQDAFLELHESHILNAGGWTFYSWGSSWPQVVDLKSNWWGSVEPEQIRAWTRDAEDGATNVTVLFEPFHGMPITTDKNSFGELKARFKD